MKGGLPSALAPTRDTCIFYNFSANKFALPGVNYT